MPGNLDNKCRSRIPSLLYFFLFSAVFFVPVHLNRLSFDVTVFLFSQDSTVVSFSLVMETVFFPQWESVQHPLVFINLSRCEFPSFWFKVGSVPGSSTYWPWIRDGKIQTWDKHPRSVTLKGGGWDTEGFSKFCPYCGPFHLDLNTGSHLVTLPNFYSNILLQLIKGFY